MLRSNRSYVALVLIFFVMDIYVSVNSTESGEIYSNSSTIAKSRMKRYLIFQPGTRIFFRVNVKDNIVQVNQIFAHAFGFRANIDLLQPQRPGHKVRRRDVYETVEQLINQHGLNGRACILKTFCDASKEAGPQSGMLFKLFKLIFTQRSPSDVNSFSMNDERDFPYFTSTSNNCEELEKHCPLSLLEMTPYTDV